MAALDRSPVTEAHIVAATGELPGALSVGTHAAVAWTTAADSDDDQVSDPATDDGQVAWAIEASSFGLAVVSDGHASFVRASHNGTLLDRWSEPNTVADSARALTGRNPNATTTTTAPAPVPLVGDPVGQIRWGGPTVQDTIIDVASAPGAGTYLAVRTGGVDRIVALDSAGTQLWIHGAPGVGTIAGIDVDVEGNVYVVGNSTSNAAITGEVSAGGVDAVVYSLDPSGALVWADQIGTASVENGKAVSVGADGNVYMVGVAGGTLPGQTKTNTSEEVLVAGYTTSGERLALFQFGAGTAATYATGVTSAADGTIYVGGYGSAGQLWGSWVGGNDAYVAAFSPSGQRQWGTVIGSASTDISGRLDIDAAGNVYLAGVTTAALPGNTFLGGADGFVAQVSPSGTLQWVDQFGSAGTELIFDVAVVGDFVYTSGSTNGALPGQEQLGGKDVVVSSHSRSGARQWARQYGTAHAESEAVVAAAGSGIVTAEHTNASATGTLSTRTDVIVRHLG